MMRAILVVLAIAAVPALVALKLALFLLRVALAAVGLAFRCV